MGEKGNTSQLNFDAEQIASMIALIQFYLTLW